jgi:beta-lactamase regulating signal transducer with metallopeptidase domain
VHEHIARAMYYLSIHLLFASIVGGVAWGLTSTLRASATTKYWIWVATALNFVLPTGALIDKLWAPHFTWAYPLGAIGGPVWDMTGGRGAVVFATVWIGGTVAMLIRLTSRIRREHRDSQPLPTLSNLTKSSEFFAEGIPVAFGDKNATPAVRGVLSQRILLPSGLDRILNPREFRAVLLHELAHARRRDNLIRLVYEAALCALWFHPFMWLAGARLSLYRELSCDESVVRREHGPELVCALAKLAIPRRSGVLQAAASSHLSDRLALLSTQSQTPSGTANLLAVSLFFAIVTTGIFQTIAHTACCFITKR